MKGTRRIKIDLVSRVNFGVYLISALSSSCQQREVLCFVTSVPEGLAAIKNALKENVSVIFILSGQY